MKQTIIIVTLGMAVLFTGACSQSRFAESVLNPMNLKLPFLPEKEPIRIGISLDDAENVPMYQVSRWGTTQKVEPWLPMGDALSRRLGRPVRFVPLTPMQIAHHLDGEYLNFALVSENDFSEIRREVPDAGVVLASSVKLVKQGYIVASARSNIADVGEIAEKRFAFGPAANVSMQEPADTELHEATLKTLADEGVPLDKIQATVLPVPTREQFHLTWEETAKEIVFGVGTAAGVLEANFFESLPKTGGQWNPVKPKLSQDQFRILAKTKPIIIDIFDRGPFIASNKTDEKTVSKIRRFLEQPNIRDRRAMASLGIERFTLARNDG
jgi:ABC-type phosphate/phosphonate transport system substrate-binding protein